MEAIADVLVASGVFHYRIIEMPEDPRVGDELNLGSMRLTRGRYRITAAYRKIWGSTEFPCIQNIPGAVEFQAYVKEQVSQQFNIALT